MPRKRYPDQIPHSLRWMKERLVEKGWPVTRLTTTRSNRMRLGPLEIFASSYLWTSRVVDKYGHEMKPGDGKAFAVIYASREKPDTMPAQVLMSLESFTQIVEWLIEGDKDSFLRDTRPRRME